MSYPGDNRWSGPPDPNAYANINRQGNAAPRNYQSQVVRMAVRMDGELPSTSRAAQNQASFSHGSQAGLDFSFHNSYMNNPTGYSGFGQRANEASNMSGIDGSMGAGNREQELPMECDFDWSSFGTGGNQGTVRQSLLFQSQAQYTMRWGSNGQDRTFQMTLVQTRTAMQSYHIPEQRPLQSMMEERSYNMISGRPPLTAGPFPRAVPPLADQSNGTVFQSIMAEPSTVSNEGHQDAVPPAAQDSDFPYSMEIMPYLESMPTGNEESLVEDLSDWCNYINEPEADALNQENQGGPGSTANPNESQAQSMASTTNPTDIMATYPSFSGNYTRTLGAPSKPTRGKVIKARNPLTKKEPPKRKLGAPMKPSISQLLKEAAKKERLANAPPKKQRKTKPKASAETNSIQNPDPAEPSQPSTSAAAKPPKRTYTKRASTAKKSKVENNAEAAVATSNPAEALGPSEVKPGIPLGPIDLNIPTPTIRTIGKTIKPKAPRRKKTPVVPTEGSEDGVPPPPKTKAEAPPKPRAPRKPRKPRQTKAALKKQQEEEEALRLLAAAPTSMEPIPKGMPLEGIPKGIPIEPIPKGVAIELLPKGMPTEPIPTREVIEPVPSASTIGMQKPVAGQFISATQGTPQYGVRVQNSPTKPSASQKRPTPKAAGGGKSMKNVMKVFGKKAILQIQSFLSKVPGTSDTTILEKSTSAPNEHQKKGYVQKNRSVSPCLSKHSARSTSRSSSGSDSSSRSSSSCSCSSSSSSSGSSSSGSSSSGSSSSGSSSSGSSSSGSSSSGSSSSSCSKKTKTKPRAQKPLPSRESFPRINTALYKPTNLESPSPPMSPVQNLGPHRELSPPMTPMKNLDLSLESSPQKESSSPPMTVKNLDLSLESSPQKDTDLYQPTNLESPKPSIAAGKNLDISLESSPKKSTALLQPTNLKSQSPPITAPRHLDISLKSSPQKYTDLDDPTNLKLPSQATPVQNPESSPQMNTSVDQAITAQKNLDLTAESSPQKDTDLKQPCNLDFGHDQPTNLGSPTLPLTPKMNENPSLQKEKNLNVSLNSSPQKDTDLDHPSPPHATQNNLDPSLKTSPLKTNDLDQPTNLESPKLPTAPGKNLVLSEESSPAKDTVLDQATNLQPTSPAKTTVQNADPPMDPPLINAGLDEPTVLGSPSPPSTPCTNPLTFEDLLKHLGAEIAPVSPIVTQSSDALKQEDSKPTPAVSESSTNGGDNRPGTGVPIPKMDDITEKKIEKSAAESNRNLPSITHKFKTPVKSVEYKASGSTKKPDINPHNPKLLECNQNGEQNVLQTPFKMPRPIKTDLISGEFKTPPNTPLPAKSNPQKMSDESKFGDQKRILKPSRIPRPIKGYFAAQYKLSLQCNSNISGSIASPFTSFGGVTQSTKPAPLKLSDESKIPVQKPLKNARAIQPKPISDIYEVPESTSASDVKMLNPNCGPNIARPRTHLAPMAEPEKQGFQKLINENKYLDRNVHEQPQIAVQEPSKKTKPTETKSKSALSNGNFCSPNIFETSVKPCSSVIAKPDEGLGSFTYTSTFQSGLVKPSDSELTAPKNTIAPVVNEEQPINKSAEKPGYPEIFGADMNPSDSKPCSSKTSTAVRDHSKNKKEKKSRSSKAKNDGKKPKSPKTKKEAKKPGSSKKSRTSKNLDPKFQDQLLEDPKKNSFDTDTITQYKLPEETPSEAQVSSLKPSKGKKPKTPKHKKEKKKSGSAKGTRNPAIRKQVLQNAKVNLEECELRDVLWNPKGKPSEAQIPFLKPSEEPRTIEAVLKSSTKLFKANPPQLGIKFCSPQPLTTRRSSLPAISKRRVSVAVETGSNLIASSRKIAIPKRRESVLIDDALKSKALKPTSNPKRSFDELIAEADLIPLSRGLPAAKRRHSVMIEQPAKRGLSVMIEQPVKAKIRKTTTETDMKPSTSKAARPDTAISAKLDTRPSTSKAAAAARTANTASTSTVFETDDMPSTSQKPHTFLQFKIPKLRAGGSIIQSVAAETPEAENPTGSSETIHSTLAKSPEASQANAAAGSEATAAHPTDASQGSSAKSSDAPQARNFLRGTPYRRSQYILPGHPMRRTLVNESPYALHGHANYPVNYPSELAYQRVHHMGPPMRINPSYPEDQAFYRDAYFMDQQLRYHRYEERLRYEEDYPLRRFVPPPASYAVGRSAPVPTYHPYRSAQQMRGLLPHERIGPTYRPGFPHIDDPSLPEAHANRAYPPISYLPAQYQPPDHHPITDYMGWYRLSSGHPSGRPSAPRTPQAEINDSSDNCS
ncbi:titin [Drosophila biarmipes]|uniref:titin n=1 Tax=Drosophila biarmipes TaxID=125945 RepID=UPI0007E662B9|nr:titin [Drosophila biarmipes]